MESPRMREGFAHDATVTIAPDGDADALGAAITVALCGRWDHDPPCPLAPHHTRAERTGDLVRLRTLFAVEPELERRVRDRIDDALHDARFVAPGGVTTRWRFEASERGEIREQERDHLGRLIGS
ncbi:hypothetical protein [Microbacterium deminutum]|uniref:DUF3168 domain-containing protein n=1 Tax=Microbacterium deminutum TaxID=344164 RepID=A0ABN2RG76_9MICO